MKNAFLILFVLGFTTAGLAQTSRSKKTSSDNPRIERKIAITTEAGLRTTSGTGLNLSYYVHPQVAIDAGAGVGLQGLKFGGRARYLFMDQEFSPILGIGFNMAPQEFNLSDFGIENQTFEINHDLDDETPKQEVEIDLALNKSYYGQVFTGIEWMAQGGFVVAFNLGYRISLNQTIDTTIKYNDETFEVVDQYTDRFLNSVDKIYGSGFSTSLHIGYAF